MQPYLTSGTNKQQPKPNQSTYGSSASAGAGAGGYGAPSSYQPAASSYGNNNNNNTGGYTATAGTSAYAPAATTNTNTYGSSAATSTNTYGSSYGTPASAMATTSAATSTNTYGSSYGTPASTMATTSVPAFSQALSNPPPQSSAPNTSMYGTAAASSSSYGTSTVNTRNTYDSSSTTSGRPPASNPGYSEAVVATPVNNTGGYGGGGVAPSSAAVSSVNSTNYTGGPTGGLVSEGNPTKCHKVDYEIKGHEMQIVEIELDPQETVIAEAGALMYLEDGIDFKTKFGDGSTPKEGFFKKLLNAGGRLLMGESLFITHFTQQGSGKARVAFGAPYPGTIIPMNLANLNGKVICQKDAFLCAAKGSKISIHFNKKIGSGLFGGEGFILQKIEGDGMAFVHAGGMIIKKELRGGKLRVDTGCVMAFTEGINFDIEFTPGLKSMIFGGEGLFLATLQGTGTVWLQSLPFSRFADRVIQNAPSAGGRRKGEGSALTGGFGDMINGDGFGFK